MNEEREYIDEYYEEEEVWKEVVLYGSKYRYEISNKRNVRTFKTHHESTLFMNTKDFRMCLMYQTEDGKCNYRYIDTLIELAFRKREIAEQPEEFI